MGLKNFFLLSLLIVASHLGVLSCSKKSAGDDKTLYVALSAPPSTLDPRFATDANGMRISHLLFNSLVRLGPDLKIVGDAASSWEYKDLLYTFHLRPGISFSNGFPLTKEDLLFTFKQYQSESSPFRSSLEPIKEIEVSDETDDHHFIVKLKLSQFSATLLTDLTPVKLLSQRVLSEKADFSVQPIGSGSFVLKSQTANEILLEARKDHPVLTPKMERVVFKIIKDDNTRYLKVLKGDIDIAQSELPPSKIPSLSTNSDLVVHKSPGLAMSYILVNLNDPKLSQLKLRQALAHAIHREEIIQYKLEGLATPATSILTPGNPYFDSNLKNLPFDLEKGRELIRNLGFEGSEFTLKTSNSQDAVENGKILVNQLEKLGIKIKLQSYEWGTFYDDVKKGQFQLATMRWVGATDPDIYRIAFHQSELPPGRNRGSYKNVNLDRLLEEGLKIDRTTERIQHYSKVQSTIMDDLPIIPLWYNTQVAVVHRRVKNYIPPMNGDFSPLAQVSK